MEEYRLENEQLRKTVDLLSNRVVELEQVKSLVRSSVIQFHQDVQVQKQKQVDSILILAGIWSFKLRCSWTI